MDRNTELIHEIGNALMHDRWLTEEASDWDAVSLSVRVGPGSVGMSGYTYTDDGEGPEAGTPEAETFFEQFRELQATMAKVSEKPWVACLLTINRSTGKMNIDFEYEDPNRWKVMPINVGTLPQEMRPQPKP